jgi:hypothetical protein
MEISGMGKTRLLIRNSVQAFTMAATTIASYWLFIRPWMLRWGMPEGEAPAPLPGDALVEHPMLETTRAITIQAPVEKVWPWLVQIGFRRGGFYSYDALENLMGLHIRSTRMIRPEWQTLAVGDVVPLAETTPMMVEVLEPNRALVLHITMDPFTARPVDRRQVDVNTPYIHWTWAFILQRLSSSRSRLTIRTRANYQPEWLKPLVWFILDPVHFVMERKMLIGIKERAQNSTPEHGEG